MIFSQNYVIKTYESKNFSTAADLFEKIRMGDDETLLRELSDFYDCDHSRAFQIKLEEYEYTALDDPDISGFLIDSRDVTPIIANYRIQSKNEN